MVPCFKQHADFNDNELFLLACEYERLELVKELMQCKEVDPSAHNNKAILSACMRHSFSMGKQTTESLIRLLLQDKRVNPREGTYGELQEARKYFTFAQLFNK